MKTIQQKIKDKTASLAEIVGIPELAGAVRTGKTSALGVLSIVRDSGIKNEPFLKHLAEVIEIAKKYNA